MAILLEQMFGIIDKLWWFATLKTRIEVLNWVMHHLFVRFGFLILMNKFSDKNYRLLSIQVEFAKRAFQEPELRTAHNVHKMSTLLGGALFIADDIFPDTPYLHAGWHLAAAIGVGTCNKLLE